MIDPEEGEKDWIKLKPFPTALRSIVPAPFVIAIEESKLVRLPAAGDKPAAPISNWPSVFNCGVVHALFVVVMFELSFFLRIKLRVK